MGFIRAFTGAIGGTFADQWKDFIMPRTGVPATAALFEGVPNNQNAGRGANTRGSENIITNGSKILIPEGTAMITMQDGAITGLIAEPGGYTFSSDDQNSKSFFGGDGILSSTIKTSWERFKFGGIPGSQQTVFYVNLREIPNNRFGTQSPIYWDDAFLGTQAGAKTRGTYTMKIVDPLLFIKRFVPVKYLKPNAPIFDFADMENDAAAQLFSEVVASLAGAFSHYTNDPAKGNRITRIQGDAVGFAQSLSVAVEEGYQWSSDRGLQIVRVALKAIEYDASTNELMKKVREMDAMGGARANTFMQMSAARGMEAMGSNPGGGGGMGMAFMGMGANAMGNMVQGLQQPVQQQAPPPQGNFCPQTGQPLQPQGNFCPQTGRPLHQQQATAAFCPQTGQPLQQQATAQTQTATAETSAENPVARLKKMKELLDLGVISQEEFDAAKKQVLGF